jgi:carbamoyltransferase
MIVILGISAFYHDSAAALIIDGEIFAAAQEERFTRKKHDASFPFNSIIFCLEQAKLKFEQVDYISFYDKPLLKFERLIETYVAFAPRGFKSFNMAIPVWLREKLFLKSTLTKNLRKIDKNFSSNKLMFGEHHFSHASSAFYASPFEEALVLTIDGVGEWATTSVAIGKGNNLDIVREIHFPHSLGLLYSAFTYYLGFKVNGGEYKVMGLAPYGEPKYKNKILENLVDLKEDGSFFIDQSYFNYSTGLTMINKKFSDLFEMPVRKMNSENLTQFHMDIAASIQAVTEDIVLNITRSLAKEFNISNLCMAGGVALNCVANGKVLRDKAFSNLWIQPAAGDAGGAIGVALALWYKELNMPRNVNLKDSMKGSYLGPSFNEEDIKKELIYCGAVFEKVTEVDMINKTAKALSDGNIVGWFQGRMEFGPRALGARSILGDPRVEDMQKILNLKVKYRESFRPFAPSVLKEDVSNWFEADYDSPYMLLVDKVNKEKCIKMTKKEQSFFGIDKLNVKRSQIPAVTHIDYSARIHTVHEDTNKLYHALISRFKEITGCSVIVNTSFNIRGEPIVCSPSDAYKCFMGTKIDLLIIGNFMLKKEKQGCVISDKVESLNR